MSIFSKTYNRIMLLLGADKIVFKVKGKCIYDKIPKTEESLYFVLSHGIGDIVWTASFINSYILFNNINNNINIICLDRDQNILKSYMPNANYILFGKSELINLGIFAQSKYNTDPKLQALIYPKLKCAKKMSAELETFSQIGMEMDICYKYGCFDLPESGKFEKPNLDSFAIKADEFISDNQLIIGKTVILVPFINSRLTLPCEEWAKMAKDLRELGFNVYTNIGSKNDRIIDGTKGLLSPLEILPLIIKKTGCVISGRCGLGDWLFVNSCKMIMIHTYKDSANLSENEKIQSSFARKESFQIMKNRCHIVNDNFYEFRLKQNGDNSQIINVMINEIVSMMENVK